MVRIFGLALLVGSAVVGVTAQDPDRFAALNLPPCDQLDALHIPMQMNLRATAAMVACGRETAGEEAELADINKEAGSVLVGTNLDVITGVETSPHTTQSEHQIWANGSTVVINYNDSKDAASAQFSGVSYSTDGGATYTRILPSPFATGHGSNYGDPTVVFNKSANKWVASDLVGGCGSQGIGTWTSPNGIAWSAGPCVHVGGADDRQSMTVDNTPTSPFYGRMYTSWNDFNVGGGALVTSTSTDGGATWGAPVTVLGSFIRDVQIQAAPNGTVLLATMNEGGGGSANRQNVMYRSTDGGVTWSSGITMGAAFAPPGDFNSGYFRVVTPIWRHMGWGDLATGANGVVMYSYARNGGPGDTGDIYTVRSTDTGLTWGAPVRMDGSTLNNEQWMPSTAGGGSYFLVSWYDRKNVFSGGGTGGTLITNGGLESGDLTGWTVDGTNPSPSVSNVEHHSGTWSVHLGSASGPEPLGDGSLYATVAVPASNPGFLTFWFKGTTTDSISFDWQDAYITNTSGTILATIMHTCTTTSGWVQKGIDMRAFAGQTVRVKFLVHQDGFGDDTDMYVDDVAMGSTPLAVDYERFGRISRDGGVTWAPTKRISDMVIPQPAQPDPNVQALYAGDYMRSYFDGTTFYDGWTDGRIVVVVHQQDVETQRFRVTIPFDFNLDVKTDRTLFAPSTGYWYSLLSGGGATSTPWGSSTDIDVAADYDGDGKTDLAVFRPSTGTWYILNSATGTVTVQAWGASGDVPLAGDIDGDGKADIAVFRNGSWFVLKSAGGTSFTGWGAGTDVPLMADFDGDGKDDIAVFRPSNGFWYGLLSNGGALVYGWGQNGDVPVIGDWDGDGKNDVTVFRPSTGQWFVSRTTGGTLITTWGGANDTPITGDFDGDGKSDFTVWRGATGTWYTQYLTGGFATVTWGSSGMHVIGRLQGT